MDELFPDAPAQLALIDRPRHARATCCGCGMLAVVPVGQPPLCQFCAEDLPAARGRVATLRALCEARRATAEQAYRDATAAATPLDRATMARIADGWPRTQRLLGDALASGRAPLAALARAWACWQTAIDSTARELAQCGEFERHFGAR